MKNVLTSEFKTRLWEAVKSVEKQSQVELVVVMRSSSHDYRYIALSWGIVAALLVHSYVVLAPEIFEDWLVYCAPLIGFTATYAVAHLPWVIRLSAGFACLQKNVEIMARATFQKGGIQHTQAKIGVLIYCSFLEKIVYILPDRGVETALPAEEWQNLHTDFQQIFAHRNPGEALLKQIQQTARLFNRYLPLINGDINELPDVLEIDL